MDYDLKKPMFSILMPVYNEEKYILEAINSVLKQTYQNFELIVINDGCNDSTISLIKKNINDNRLILIDKMKKIGKNKAFNLGYLKSRGEWLIYFAGDDIMKFDSLEIRNKYLKKYNSKKKIASFSKLQTISKNKKFDGIVMPKTKGARIHTGGVLTISKAMAEKVFPLPENLPNEDTWTYLNIKHFSDETIDINHIALYLRRHENNSNPIDLPFREKNEKLHDRFLVYGLFREKFDDKLSKDEIKHLEKLELAENLRYNKKILKLLFLNGLSLRKKIKFLAYSNFITYNIKVFFHSFLSGLGES